MDKRRTMKSAVDPSVLAPLGRITANFNMLSWAIASFVWSLIGSDQRTGQIITAEMSFKNILNAWASLYQHRVSDPELLARMKALVTRASAAEEMRNTFAHSLWGAGLVTIKETARAKRGLDFRFTTRSAAEIDAFADDLEFLSADVQDLLLATIAPVKVPR